MRKFLPDFHLKWLVREGWTNMRTMLACETYGVLADRQITKMKSEFPAWLGTLKRTEVNGLGFYLNESIGGGVICLRNLDEVSKYKGAEFAAIAIDQLEQITEETFTILRLNMRWSDGERPFDHTRFVATGNPLGIGHNWNVAYFLEKKLPAELKGREDQFYFLKALPKDNPYLSQDYWDELNALPPKLKRAWAQGDYYVYVGQAFDQFSERHICRPFKIPDNWLKWRAIDYGYKNPFCCLWFTVDPNNGRVFVYREAYESGLSDAQQARLVKYMSPGYERVKLTFADPSMWAKRTLDETITSTDKVYKREGVYLNQADNDRKGGKRKIDRLMMDWPDGRPGLIIFNTCTNLIREIPGLIINDKDPEDVLKSRAIDDHAYDTLKYGLTNIVEKRVERLPAKIPDNKYNIYKEVF